VQQGFSTKISGRCCRANNLNEQLAKDDLPTNAEWDTRMFAGIAVVGK
jgi:hypothetical protein